MDEAIWYDDPRALVAHPNWLRFVPTSDLSVAGQLNASLRLAVYFALAMVALTGSPRYLVVVLVVAGLTAAVGKTAGGRSPRREGFRRAGECTPPTAENPYMNFMHGADDPDRPPACPLPLSAHAADRRAGRAPQDHVWDRSAHRFYTMPSTTAASDQARYADVLYGDMPGKADGVRRRGSPLPPTAAAAATTAAATTAAATTALGALGAGIGGP